ncbi:hypothetical protein EIP86_008646 [Pleurotus ostreatoroseus]|nr:hypothetical protein EIP86_008646 [Pleurotus ostreatoroseus]
MDSNATFPSFAAALDAAMSLNLDELWGKSCRAPLYSELARESMSPSRVIHEHNYTCSDLSVMSTVDVFDQGLIPSYSDDTRFSVTDRFMCTPPTEAFTTVGIELVPLSPTLSTDMTIGNVESLSLVSLSRSIPVYDDPSYAWSPQARHVPFDAPVQHPGFQASHWATLETASSPYPYDEPSPSYSLSVGSPSSTSSFDSSDEESGVLEMDQSPGLSNHSTYRKIHATRRASTSSNVSSSSNASSYSRTPRSPRKSRSPRSPTKPGERRRPSPRAAQVPAGSAPLEPVNGACPYCGYVPRKPGRNPDLMRHIGTHRRDEQAVTWVCCGVPIAEAAQYGMEDFKQDDVKWVSHVNMLMVGGCGEQFSRKDAYQRHLKAKSHGCVGNPNGSWFSRVKGSKGSQSLETA